MSLRKRSKKVSFGTDPANLKTADPKRAVITYNGDDTFNVDGRIVSRDELANLAGHKSDQWFNGLDGAKVLPGFGDCVVTRSLVTELLNQSAADRTRVFAVQVSRQSTDQFSSTDDRDSWGSCMDNRYACGYSGLSRRPDRHHN